MGQITLKNVLMGDNLPEVQEHRVSDKIERPVDEITLYSVSKESVHATKTQLDPTEDLVAISHTYESLDDMQKDKAIALNGYLVWCNQTKETWFAPTLQCLNMNFIYRQDLEIYYVDTIEDAWYWFDERGNKVDYGISTCKKCYLLDNPGNETYEVYYDSNYPALRYGKSTPQGCFVHVYNNRFHRDMAILKLDKLYSNASGKAAGKLTAKRLKKDEAIIISDGAWMKDVCASAYVYLDDENVEQNVQGTIPSEPDQAVLIAEINGAYRALKQCMNNSKRNITYYYDNTSILNVFKNRKTEYITEVKRYKDLLNKLDQLGYNVVFVELHPKTGETRDTDNKALTFFHNRCDNLCREMADTVKKDYKAYASEDKKTNSKNYKQVKEETAPKKKNNNYSGLARR